MSPRWNKVGRDLWRAKLRTFLVVISITVGVFAVGTIASTRILFSQDISDGFLAINPAAAQIYPPPFTDDLVRTVRRMDGVKDVEGRRRATLRVQTGPEQAPNWRTLRLELNPDFAGHRIYRLALEHGTWPKEKGELVIERSTVAFLKAQIGDNIMVETVDNKQHPLIITGIVHDLYKPPATFSGQIYGYAGADTFDLLRIDKRFTELNITVAERPLDKQHIQSVVDGIKRRLENTTGRNVLVQIPPPGEHPATETANTFLLVLGVLGAITLGLSAFLVVNTISAVLAQQVPQIGVMKAIGARSAQLTSMYLVSVTIYGMLALLIAVPLGAMGAWAFTAYLATLINYTPGSFRIPIVVLLLQAVVALVVPLLAALWPVMAGARITIMEALNAAGGRGTFGLSLFDRLVASVSGALRVPRPILLSLRATFRRKARLALTLSTLTLGGAIFIAVLTVQASLSATLDEFLAYWKYDVNVNFTQPRRIEQLVEEVKQVPGVVDAESWRFGSARRVRADGQEGIDLQLVAPPAETRLVNPVVLSGRWLLPDDENALVINSEVTKEESDLKVGSEVMLKIDGKEHEWRVVGIVKAIMSGPTVYATFPYVAALSHNVGRANGVQVVTEHHDAAFQNRTVNALKQHLDGVGLKVAGTGTISSTRQNVESQFNILVVFLAIMAALLAVVGGLGLMGTMSINVLERSREIGVMRAIGASDGAVIQVFLVEGLLIGLLSWAAGTLLSLPISRLLSDVVGNAFMRHPLTYTFSPQGAALWLGVVVVLAGLASFFPAFRASRLTVREVLAYE
ncbi:MAG TPA: FtsX-like permease family protein [Chloroflexota bacterium]|nr:FtsX-like permease family protein [Chloroflexota bacterium]